MQYLVEPIIIITIIIVADMRIEGVEYNKIKEMARSTVEERGSCRGVSLFDPLLFAAVITRGRGIDEEELG